MKSLQKIVVGICLMGMGQMSAMETERQGKFGPYPERLHDAIMRQDHAAIDKELEDATVKQQINNMGGPRNYTALQLAAFVGNTDIAKSLILVGGAKIDARGSYQDAPLHTAAKKGNTKMVKFLVEKHGAQVDSRNDEQETPLHLAAAGGFKDIVEFLKEANKKTTDATEVKDSSGRTPMFRAAENNRIPVLKYFLIKNADFTIKDTVFGDTMLHVAAKNGFPEVVKTLLDQKKMPDIHAKNYAGETALSIAKDGADYSPNKRAIAELLK